MIRVSKIAIIFGGNYFTDKLPPAKCWICWDKQIPKGFSKAQIELAWTNSKSYSRIYSILWNGMIRDKNDENAIRYHPTQKPFNLMKAILWDFSKSNDLVMDCFMGSGTTGIACRKLNRRFIGIEIEPKYFEIAQRRINQATMELFI